MNQTDFPRRTDDESDRNQLADEISDVIEEHGRGLDADEISTTIESLVTEYTEPEDSDVISNASLRRELVRFVESHGENFERSRILETFRRLADELRQSSLEPEVRIERGEDPYTVVLAFNCAFALERTLPKLFDVRGYFVEADVPLTYLDEIRLRVRASTIRDAVELDGCVSRTAPNGFTVQVWQPSMEVERRLRELPDRMRSDRV